MIKHVLFALLALGASACSTGPAVKASEQPVREPPAKTLESQYVAAAESADAVAEVQFAKGSAKLAPSQRRKLEKAYKFARKKGTPAKAQVVTWSDSEYPAAGAPALPHSADDLAKRRATEIQNVLKTFDGFPNVHTSTYTMTERPTTLDGLLHHSDKKLKADFEEAGLNSQDHKVAPFAGKGVVLILNKAAPEKAQATQGDSTLGVKP